MYKIVLPPPVSWKSKPKEIDRAHEWLIKLRGSLICPVSDCLENNPSPQQSNRSWNGINHLDRCKVSHHTPALHRHTPRQRETSSDSWRHLSASQSPHNDEVLTVTSSRQSCHNDVTVTSSRQSCHNVMSSLYRGQVLTVAPRWQEEGLTYKHEEVHWSSWSSISPQNRPEIAIFPPLSAHAPAEKRYSFADKVGSLSWRNTWCKVNPKSSNPIIITKENPRNVIKRWKTKRVKRS